MALPVSSAMHGRGLQRGRWAIASEVKSKNKWCSSHQGLGSLTTPIPSSPRCCPLRPSSRKIRIHRAWRSIEGVGGHQTACRVPGVGGAGRNHKRYLIAVDAPDAARAGGARDAHLDGLLAPLAAGPTSKAAVHDVLTALALAVRPTWRDHVARLLLAVAALGTKYVDVEAKGA